MKQFLARRPWTSSVMLGAAAILLRAALLPLLPHPISGDHDGASYVFQAEIFAHGRLTFPTHPLWRFFQTANVISHPVWMSKYFGGQALFLAIGVLLGNAHWGVVLSFAVFVVAAHWLLRQIVPPWWALIGALAVLAVFNVRHYWLESYWGGFVAAAGGCFTLGALISRPTARRRARWLLPLGAVLLCTTRPFEGLVFTVLGGAVFLAGSRETLRTQLARWAAPLGAAALISAAVMFSYNWLTLGNPLRLPYMEHERQYTMAPSFWFLPARNIVYDDPVLQAFHQREVAAYRRLLDLPLARRIPFLFLRYVKSSVFDVFGFSFAPLLLLPWYLKNARIRRLTLLWVLLAVPLIFEVWMFPHYTAPVTGALIVLGVSLARAFLIRFRRTPRLRRIAATGLLAVVFVPAVWPDVQAVVNPAQESPRQNVIRALAGSGQRNVIFVRYTNLDWHAAYDDWVHVSPNVDDQAIIWARDRGPENATLIRYYAVRRFWLLNPDETPLRLQPVFGGTPIPIP